MSHRDAKSDGPARGKTRKKKNNRDRTRDEATCAADDDAGTARSAKAPKKRSKLKLPQQKKEQPAAAAGTTPPPTPAPASAPTPSGGGEGGGGTATGVATGKTAPDVELAMADFAKTTSLKGVDGLRKEFLELKTYTAPEFKYEVCSANAPKNRYRDVVCLDATRVTLTLNVPPESDYIHANWVKMEGLERKYIATQGPLDSTIADFWRMVFQENATSVVMVCKFVEDQKNKCAVYFPEEQGAYKNYGSMFVNNKKVERNEDLQLTTYTLEVLPDGCSNSNIVKLLQYSEWPDRGVPDSPKRILKLIMNIPAGLCVLHCSAGIGRTGTVIAIDTTIHRLKKGGGGGGVQMKEVFHQLRNQRASAIQTEAQYVYVYSAVMEYIRVKVPKAQREGIMTYFEEVKKANLI